MEEKRDDLDNYILEIVDLMSEDRRGVKIDKIWKIEITERGIPGKRDDQRWRNRRLYVKEMNQ